MNHNAEESPRWYQKWELRLIAAVLALALLLSISANIFVGIRIQRGGDAQAAGNYLVDNTDYLDQTTGQRLGEKLQTLQPQETLEDYYRLAGTQIAEEKYDLALQNIEICIDMYEGDNQELYEDLLMKQGCLLVLLAQYDQAITALDQVIEANPRAKDAYLVKAQVYAELDDTENLIQVLQAYLELDAGDKEIRLLLAEIYFQTADYAQTVALYENASTASEDPKLTYLAGMAYLQRSDYDHALTALEQVKQADPSAADLDYYIGICQMSLGQYEQSIQSLTAAIDQGSMIQLSCYSRGICRVMLEGSQSEEGLEDLRQAAGYEGEDADQLAAQQASELLKELTAQQP